MKNELNFQPEPFGGYRAFDRSYEFDGWLDGEQWESETDRNAPEYIHWVQRSLNKILGLRLVEDGISGRATRSAIRSFQQQKGLGVDGIVGSQTEEALIAAGKGSLPPSLGAPSYIPTPYPVSSRINTPIGSLAFITVGTGVITTPTIERILRELDDYFRQANLPVKLTSAVRTPEKQLGIIKRAASKHGVDQKYPSIKTATVDDIESWLNAWDALLYREKFIVNPPKPVTSRITGKRIDISPHMKGQAIDLSGVNLDKIASVVQHYCQNGGTISQILIERVNNAVHVGIRARGVCTIT